MKPCFVWILAVSGGILLNACTMDEVYTVHPSGETQFSSTAGDADDPAIWVHPTDPSLSVVIGTDKEHGLAVFDLEGNEIQHLHDGRLNNVDVRYEFALGDTKVDIVTAANRTDNRLMIYTMDPDTRKLTYRAARDIVTDIVVYGSCMYHSRTTGKYYSFINSQEGEVEQWELMDAGNGRIDAKMVRTFDVGGQTEGCVADDEPGDLYIGEEERAIWKYRAEPEGGDSRIQVDEAGTHFTADVEGLALYYGPNGSGYLIASSQGDDSYVIYTREGNHDFVMKFQITDGNGWDGVHHTDGLEICNLPLGERFPSGLLVVHDGPDKNFKFIRWEDIAHAPPKPLRIHTAWNPRWMKP